VEFLDHRCVHYFVENMYLCVHVILLHRDDIVYWTSVHILYIHAHSSVGSSCIENVFS